MRTFRTALLIVVFVGLLAFATGNLDVYFIDVGHGDAILIDYGNWECLLDAGKNHTKPRNALFDTLANTVEDNRIELAILSHNHWDHYGGFTAILDPQSARCSSTTTQTYSISHFWRSIDGKPDTCGPKWLSFGRALKDTCLEMKPVSTGTIRASYLPSDLEWCVLSPEDVSDTKKNDNQNSLVLLLKFAAVSFLFTGDIEGKAETALQTPERLPGTLILKVAHHGSASSSSTPFLQWADPELAIVSGLEKDLDPETIASLGENGIPYMTTFDNGTICVSTNGSAVWIKTGTAQQRTENYQSKDEN